VSVAPSAWRLVVHKADHVGKVQTMSRHVPRHERWTRHGPNEYRSGSVAVRFERGAWWAVLAYRHLPADLQPTDHGAWEVRSERLGPFKRPRNAMIAAEDRVVLLRRQLSERLTIDCPLLRS
jgi:hypothetical protein